MLEADFAAGYWIVCNFSELLHGGQCCSILFMCRIQTLAARFRAALLIAAVSCVFAVAVVVESLLVDECGLEG